MTKQANDLLQDAGNLITLTNRDSQSETWKLAADRWLDESTRYFSEPMKLIEVEPEFQENPFSDLHEGCPLCPRGCSSNVMSKDDMLYAAWVLIANSYSGDWDQDPTWKQAAVRWRDTWHESMKLDEGVPDNFLRIGDL